MINRGEVADNLLVVLTLCARNSSETSSVTHLVGQILYWLPRQQKQKQLICV